MSAFNRWWSSQPFIELCAKPAKVVASEAWHSRDAEVAELQAKLTEAERKLEAIYATEPVAVTRKGFKLEWAAPNYGLDGDKEYSDGTPLISLPTKEQT